MSPERRAEALRHIDDAEAPRRTSLGSPNRMWRSPSALRVASVAVAASLTIGAQQRAAPPDTILINGHVITVDARFSIAEAVAISAGRFSAVGTNAAIRRLAGPKTTTIDLHGQTVIPGLADGHLHDAGGGPGVDLSGARSLASRCSKR